MNRLLLTKAAPMWSAMALVAMLGASTAVFAQEPATSEHDHPAASPAAAKGCAMMAQHRDTTAAMTAADQRLTELIAKMDAAKGEARVAAIAAVVSEIAAQHSQMKKMQNGMMERMKPGMDAKHAVDPAKK